MIITELIAENVKKIRAVRIVPTGAVVQITGANGQGKSSVLDSIFWALSGTKNIDSVPVRMGEEKAVIKLNLGEFVVTRRFTKDGNTSLVVEPTDGSTKKFPSPQKMLDEILGELTFDPLAFSRMDTKSQIEQLRSMVDVGIDIEFIDSQNEEDRLTRQDLSRQLKSLRARMEAVPLEEGELPDESIDVSALLKDLAASTEKNTEIARRKIALEEIRKKIVVDKKRADELRAQAKRLTDEAAELVAGAIKDHEALLSAPTVPEPIETEELKSRVEEAQAINLRIDSRRVRTNLDTEAEELEKQVEELSLAIQDRVQTKRNAITTAQMPVEGLAFSDPGPEFGQNMEILFDDVPLAQASSSEQLRVSVAIAMAANPKLKIILVRDGSLLDSSSMILLGEIAEKNGYQVWVEKVDETGKVGIVMEDGEVKAVNEESEQEELNMEDL